MDASSHHRHQSSLEGWIDFSVQPLFKSADERARVRDKFYRIVNHFEAANVNDARYNRPALVRLTYEYARSEESRDMFLHAFFKSMALSIDGEDGLADSQVEEDLGSALFGFADYLVDNFFLPLRSSTCKTPQPSPVYQAAIQRVQGEGKHMQNFVGTPERVSELRGSCLIRDRHRCIITRQFDVGEAMARFQQYGTEARDDDGDVFSNETETDFLEVAHIIPHSLTKMDNDQLHPSKNAALSILNMFDNGVIHLIEGGDIDRPRNAMTLTRKMHSWFGDFKIFFEPIPGQLHTYRIDTFLPAFIARDQFPVTRTLYLAENRSVDPPSPRLLALHCAIAHILHLSAAGDYIHKILDDMERKVVREDGSTELSRLVTLRLGGWLDGVRT